MIDWCDSSKRGSARKERRVADWFGVRNSVGRSRGAPLNRRDFAGPGKLADFETELRSGLLRER